MVAGGRVAGCDEVYFPPLATRLRISFFQSHVSGQDQFMLSLLSKRPCVRRVKVKVVSKGMVKTLISSSEIACKTI